MQSLPSVECWYSDCQWQSLVVSPGKMQRNLYSADSIKFIKNLSKASRFEEYGSLQRVHIKTSMITIEVFVAWLVMIFIFSTIIGNSIPED